MADPGPDDDENAKVMFRTMTTEELVLYRRALTLDLAAARSPSPTVRGGRSNLTIMFCESRRAVVAAVLRERGVEAEP